MSINTKLFPNKIKTFQVCRELLIHERLLTLDFLNELVKPFWLIEKSKLIKKLQSLEELKEFMEQEDFQSEFNNIQAVISDTDGFIRENNNIILFEQKPIPPDLLASNIDRLQRMIRLYVVNNPILDAAIWKAIDETSRSELEYEWQPCPSGGKEEAKVTGITSTKKREVASIGESATGTKRLRTSASASAYAHAPTYHEKSQEEEQEIPSFEETESSMYHLWPQFIPTSTSSSSSSSKSSKK